MLFSESTLGFYDPAINTDIPSDAVEITDDVYGAMISGQESGKQIAADKNGQPVLVDRIPPAVPLTRQAQAALDDADAVALRCFMAGVAFPAEWKTYVSALRAITRGTDTTTTALPAAPSYPAGT